MYQIHANYTGAFPLNFPFDFESLQEAKQILKYLEALRHITPSWEKIKPFQIWCTQIERYVK